jgi:hypothetical protein
MNSEALMAWDVMCLRVERDGVLELSPVPYGGELVRGVADVFFGTSSLWNYFLLI